MTTTLNVKHTLLQTLLAKPFLTRKEFKKMLAPFELKIKHFMPDANELLAPLGLELRCVISDYDDHCYFGVCQVFEDVSGSECLGLKAEVVQLFYKFIDLIINSEEKGVATVPIGKLIDLAEGMQASNVQDALHKLADLGYLKITQNMVHIGPRGFIEFKPVFTKMANDQDASLQMCAICLDVALSGVRCPTCQCYVHRRCAGAIHGACPMCRKTEEFVPFG